MSYKLITLAKYAGFCYGVKRAVEFVLKLKSAHPNDDICVLGELIHNRQVIDQLTNSGIRTVNSLSEVPKGAYCVIRTHGASPEVFEQIKNSGCKVFDLTCPDVKKVQQKAVELVKDGYYLVIVGKETHPEVQAIKANAMQYGHKIVVSETVEKLIAIEKELKVHKKIGVVVQTTQMISVLNPIVKYLSSISNELYTANTICPSTSRRQNEVLELAKKNDLMIIVGSKNSANTTHLADICSTCTKTIHIETVKDLDLYNDLIEKAQFIGISAGASTPQKVIDEVFEKLDKQYNQ